MTIILSLRLGAYPINMYQIGQNMFALFTDKATIDQISYEVFWWIRLPRVCLAILVGATLAVAGVGFQGLFRNPLADAGLIGVGSGASLAAIITIVLGGQLLVNFQTVFGNYLLNIMAFIGALSSLWLIYTLSKSQGKTQIAIMLLAGIAINAIVGAVSGLITMSANEEQLRSITFWNLGSLGAATWSQIAALLPFSLCTIIIMPYLGKALNALSLSEQDAKAMGFNIERVKNTVMTICAIGVGACVALTGIIGFVGLVIPHIVRLCIGPDHRKLAIVSGLGGAILLLMADVISRTIIAPVELPIGIITSLIGGPFFLYLLLKEKKKNHL